MPTGVIDLRVGPISPIVLRPTVQPIKLKVAPSRIVLRSSPQPIKLQVAPRPVRFRFTGVGAQGPRGPAGTGGLTYHHIQSTPSLSWTVFHNLHTYPQITILIDGVTQFARVSYPNDQSALIEFNSPQSGDAYCVG